jgi:hypothetical protein
MSMSSSTSCGYVPRSWVRRFFYPCAVQLSSKRANLLDQKYWIHGGHPKYRTCAAQPTLCSSVLFFSEMTILLTLAILRLQISLPCCKELKQSFCLKTSDSWSLAEAISESSSPTLCAYSNSSSLPLLQIFFFHLGFPILPTREL